MRIGKKGEGGQTQMKAQKMTPAKCLEIGLNIKIHNKIAGVPLADKRPWGAGALYIQGDSRIDCDYWL